jgi:hypothetical protein
MGATRPALLPIGCFSHRLDAAAMMTIGDTVVVTNQTLTRCGQR